MSVTTHKREEQSSGQDAGKSVQRVNTTSVTVNWQPAGQTGWFGGPDWAPRPLVGDHLTTVLFFNRGVMSVQNNSAPSTLHCEEPCVLATVMKQPSLVYICDDLT